MQRSHQKRFEIVVADVFHDPVLGISLVAEDGESVWLRENRRIFNHEAGSPADPGAVSRSRSVTFICAVWGMSMNLTSSLMPIVCTIERVALPAPDGVAVIAWRNFIRDAEHPS